MDEAIVQQIVDELLSSLEPLETQNAALLQFLKAKGIATDEDLAPFLEQAGNASGVRWRAVRLRAAALIASAMKPAERPAEPVAAKDAEAQPAAEAGSDRRPQEESRKDEVESQDRVHEKKGEAGAAPQSSRESEVDSKSAQSASSKNKNKNEEEPEKKAA